MNRKSNLFFLTLHTFSMCVTGSLIIGLITLLNPHNTTLQNYRNMFLTNNYIFIVYVIIIAPLSEEFIFRKLIFNFLKKRTKYYNLIQALLFSIVHWNPVQSVYTFIFGIFLGNVRDSSNSVWRTVYLHIIFNITGIFFPLLIQYLSQNKANSGIGKAILYIFLFLPLFLFFKSLKNIGKDMYKILPHFNRNL